MLSGCGSDSGQSADAVGLVGPLGDEFVGGSISVVGKIKSRRYGAAKKSHLAVADEACALPDAGGDEELDMLIRC